MERKSLASEENFLAAYRQRKSGRRHDLEVLTFRLGEETYGIDIWRMREIVKLKEITEVPRVPGFLSGIITVRGTVIPVIDLRRRLRLADRALSRQTRILIVQDKDEPYGLIVDRVMKVVRLENSQIEEAPLPGGMDSEFLSGVARVDQELIILLNLAAVVAIAGDVG